MWQLDESLEYAATESEVQAKHLAQRVAKAVKRLESFPEICQIIPQYADHGIREVLAFSFRIFYSLHEDNKVVRIVAFIHGARELTDEIIE